ncbi:MAG: adenine phosphoribosyltransferase [Candidatus Zixiibacteriota bacterium]
MAVAEADVDYLRKTIRDIPDFPKRGVVFRDITPVLADERAFACALGLLTEYCRSKRPTRIVAIESRGFVFGAPVAASLETGLVLVRKRGKLPGQTVSQSYQLEYGDDAVEMSHDALNSDDRALVVDDLLATGGTAHASCLLSQRLGATVLGVVALVDLAFLPWRERLKGFEVKTFVSYDSA